MVSNHDNQQRTFYEHKSKKTDNPVFKQIIDLIPHILFSKSVQKYETDKYCSAYFTYDQLVSTMFGQLNCC
ncbi:MAG: DUF4372 domain-containing protein, partial [Dysgonamonadaceae bacterium]|nr:DUF4372 domain-containing protein [Dysgonamonadaceae bacterium]